MKLKKGVLLTGTLCVGLSFMYVLSNVSPTLKIRKVEREETLFDFRFSKVLHRTNQSINKTVKSKRPTTSYNYHRYRTADEYCKNEKKTFSRLMYRHIVVNDKYKVMYCYIPKVACSNWKRIMLILTGKMNTSDPSELEHKAVHFKFNHYLTYLSRYSVEQINLRLKTYYKFIVARNPFERTLSAYRDKLEDNTTVNHWHKDFGTKMVKMYRKTGRKKSRGNDVTFLEYLQYLTNFRRMETMNEHWQMMTTLCHPCKVKYDLIIPYEELEEYSNRVLEKIGAPNTLRFPKRKVEYNNTPTASVLTEYYKDIPLPVLDKFLDKYYSDFLLFNYSVPPALRNLRN